MAENETIEFIDDPEVDVLSQTGFNKVDVINIILPIKTDADAGKLYLPSYFLNRMLAGTHDDSENCEYWLNYVGHMVGTAWAFFRALRGSAFPTVDGTHYPILAIYHTFFRAGLFNDEPPHVKNVLTSGALVAETAIANYLEAITYKDESVGADEKFWQKMARFAYCRGLKLKDAEFNYIEKLGAAQTNTNNAIYILAANSLLGYAIGEYVKLAQGDKVPLALAKGIDSSLLGKKMADFEGIDNKIFDFLIRRTPEAFIAEDVITNYTPLATTPVFDFSALKTSNYDDVVDAIDRDFVIPKDSYDIGINHVGIGHSERGSETVDFMVIYTILDAAASPVYKHAQTAGRIQVGHGLNFVKTVLEDCADIYKDISNNSKRYKHWSQMDLWKIVDSSWMNFNIASNLNGYCPDSVYYGIRPLVGAASAARGTYGQTTGDLIDDVFASQKDMTDPVTTPTEPHDLMTPFALFFQRVQKKMRLRLYSKCTLDELLQRIWWSFELITAGADEAKKHDIEEYSFWTMVDPMTSEQLGWMRNKTGTVMQRTGSSGFRPMVFTDGSTLDYTKIKAWGMRIDVKTDKVGDYSDGDSGNPSDFHSGPRLKLKDYVSAYLPLSPQVCRTLLSLCNPGEYKKDIKSKMSEPPDGGPPTPIKDDDGDDDE